MWFLIDVRDFVVLRGPFPTAEQAFNAKAVAVLRIPAEDLAVVKVVESAHA